MEALASRSGCFAAPRRALLTPHGSRLRRRAHAASATRVRASARPDHEVMGMYIYGACALRHRAGRNSSGSCLSVVARARRLLTARAGAGAGVRAAPVDVRTGEFLASGLSTTLASPSQEARPLRAGATRATARARAAHAPCAPQALGAAVKKLVEQAEWTGHIGIGMPGRVQVRLTPRPYRLAYAPARVALR